METYKISPRIDNQSSLTRVAFVNAVKNTLDQIRPQVEQVMEQFSGNIIHSAANFGRPGMADQFEAIIMVSLPTQSAPSAIRRLQVIEGVGTIKRDEKPRIG